MSLTYHEARARAQQVGNVAYAIELDLTGADTGADTFGCRTTVTFDLADPRATTFLELTGARDLRLLVDGAPVEAAYDGHRITLHDLEPSNEVVVDARLPYVNDGDGLHRFVDPADGATYLCAYAGMDLARRVFACFDQPDLKGTIALTVTAPEAWTVVANGRLAGKDGGVSTFTTTPPLASYLFTVCAGPWASRTWEHAGLPFAWHARASLAAELDRDFEDMREVTERCFDFYARTFTEPYPFDSYDQVMGPEHNWGAMETAGCVTFRDEYLPRNEPDADELVERGSVIAHEMAHMWFGDLVTMRWWQDTWLNESFADFMGYHVAAEIGVDGSWENFALNRKPTGFAADARRSAHPVAEDAEHVTDADSAFNNFDMITYAKGAAVLRQLVTWLGWETFVEGTNAYLSEHAFGNAELADYLRALDAVTDRDVRGWAEAYLRTTGFDTVRVSRDGDVPVLEREGTRPHRLTVAGLGGGGSELVDVSDQPARLESMAGQPVLPNAGDEAYAAIRLDQQSWQALVDGLSSIEQPLQRAVAWNNAITRVGAGDSPFAELLDVARAHLAAETHPVVFEGVLAQLGSRVHQWCSPELLPEAEQVLADAAGAALDAGDRARSLAALRRVAAYSHDAERLQRWLADGRTEGGVEVDAETRWVVTRRLAALGVADQAFIESEAAADRSAGGVRGALRALASRPTEAAKAEAWQRMLDPATSNRDFLFLADGLWSAGQEALTEPYLDRYLADMPGVAARSQGFGKLVTRAFPLLPMRLERLRQLRDELAAAIPAVDNVVLRRGWDDRLDDLDVVLRVRSAG